METWRQHKANDARLMRGLPLGLALAVLLALAGCSHRQRHDLIDHWNDLSYGFHYRNADSTRLYAEKAYAQADDYEAGKAEALNNLAFAAMVKMDYERAERLLKEAHATTDNQIELLVADVQMMRLCQRESKNKEFYTYRQRAVSRLNRIREEEDLLTPRQHRRLVYAHSECRIVGSTYFYYVGLEAQSLRAFNAIDPNGEIVKDTAQLLNYYYNIGSGGLVKGDKAQVCRKEFENLVRCYLLACQYGYPYWQANALQALGEHLRDGENRALLNREYKAELRYINTDQMPDSLLAGNLAQRALQLFGQFGDVYQTAGAYRTLAECYWTLGDYRSAIICLETALSRDKAVEKAPDLVASIREQLSLAYSAIDNKPASDANRNAYLDMQEITRQDRELEARAEQLDWQSNVLNAMILAVVFAILLLAALLCWFVYMRKRGDRTASIDTLLQPLSEWEKDNAEEERRKEEQREEVEEQTAISRLQLLDNKRRNAEQRAKVSLAYSIMPLISRISHEVGKLADGKQDKDMGGKQADARAEHLEYATELTEKIGEYNNALTQWIQMRQGDISLHVESFALQDLFDVLSRSKTEYQIKGIDFTVTPTGDTVKADKILTLFMLNTMAENARKFTPEGGRITISSRSADDYVEVSVSDTGAGISEERTAGIFSHKFKPLPPDERGKAATQDRPHGFGLVNCKGIIEKYRKMSSLFRVCDIGVESEVGRGSRFYFRLPKGVARAIAWLLMAFIPTATLKAETAPSALTMAKAFADSAYFSNVNGTYRKTVAFADSCLKYLNRHHTLTHRGSKMLMVRQGEGAGGSAEIDWFHRHWQTDYTTILDIRNETAVAALALHEWGLYEYNNKVYTQLFREYSADGTLSEYVKVMQRSEANKNVAIFILVSLLLAIGPAYYFLYYRHRMRYKQCMERVDAINQVLRGNATPKEKLSRITAIWQRREDMEDSGERDLQTLSEVVGKIERALEACVRHDSERNMEFALAKDEQSRVEREKQKFYVSNNILDNCLSTLKHETMYYPSRIRQMLGDRQADAKAVREVVDYYNDLYTILCEQALRQTELTGRIDGDMVEHLFDLLRKLNNGQRPSIEAEPLQDQYVRLRLAMDALRLTRRQQAELFTPATTDFRFLVCKQLIREWGELTNARGCGIRAVGDESGKTIIEITLTQLIWKISKLSS